MITPEQRQLRRKYICSSDAPAIMGLDPYRSAADVWLDKCGQDPGFDGNKATERGNYLEPALLDFAAAEIGSGFIRNRMNISPNGLLAANFDGYDHAGEFIVEAKSSNNPDEFGEQMTDQVPERHIVQVHHGMFVAGENCRKAWMPVLLPGYRSLDFRMYLVHRDDDLADIIAQRGIAFIEQFVRLNIEPPAFKPSLEVLKRLKRTPGKIISIPQGIVDRVTVLRAAASQAEKEKKQAEAELLAAMGDADGATTDKADVTYLITKRAGYAVDPTKFRTLKIKPRKEISHVNGNDPAAIGSTDNVKTLAGGGQ